MMMKRFLLSTMATLLLVACDPKSITDVIGTSELTEKEVVQGLKEALTKGISRGAAELARENGYLNSPYKIALPDEAQSVVNKLKVIPGFKNFENEMILRLNRAAEDAASSAKPIFVKAIRDMTVRDAWDILRGEKNAATQYLHRTTYDPLYDAFQPVVLESLDKVRAAEYWEKAIKKYNSLPFVEKINPSLDDYVTNEALDGLFDKIEEEEQLIRENPSARTTELLKKVFSRQ